MATNIDQVNATNGALALSTVSDASKTLGKEDFLKLLSVQLQHQNPLEPMENTEFIAQMAQFSTLEGITNMSDGVSVMGEQILSMNNMNATGLIGKHVKVFGDEVELVAGKVTTDLSYLLMDSADKVTVNIKDENGTVVRTLVDSNAKAGPNKAVWDGKDSSGALLSPGKYTFELDAVTADGISVKSDTLMVSKVDGIVYEDSVPYLMIGGSMTNINDVMEVWGNVATADTL